MTPEEEEELKKLARDLWAALIAYHDSWAMEFRISSDPPETDYDELCSRAADFLGEPSIW